jgi:hypothetical protein
MTPGEDLEAALQRGWSFDDLEVYADHLLAKNDPRGELVALDLSPRPEQATWVQRRRAALAGWLGGALAARAGHLVQHGFLHDLRDGMAPPELLASPAGTYLRSYTTFGRHRVPDALARLAAKPRPWLSRLAIAYRPPSFANQDPNAPSIIPSAVVTALIKATPRLEEITICGDPPFAAFPHPNVKRARLDTRCYDIDMAAAKTRIQMHEQAPEPRISDDDLDLLMELVELAPDCNQLYTHGAQFAEPLPSLIARLAAAQLVELYGPVVRAASPGMALQLGRRHVAFPEVTPGRAWIEIERKELYVANLPAHVAFLRNCLQTYPVAARMHDTIVEYVNVWARLVNGRVVVDPERLERFRAAFAALLEHRGLWPCSLGNDPEWTHVEELSVELVTETAAYFSRYAYGVYWY